MGCSVNLELPQFTCYYPFEEGETAPPSICMHAHLRQLAVSADLSVCLSSVKVVRAVWPQLRPARLSFHRHSPFSLQLPNVPEVLHRMDQTGARI